MAPPCLDGSLWLSQRPPNLRFAKMGFNDQQKVPSPVLELGYCPKTPRRTPQHTTTTVPCRFRCSHRLPTSDRSGSLGVSSGACETMSWVGSFFGSDRHLTADSAQNKLYQPHRWCRSRSHGTPRQGHSERDLLNHLDLDASAFAASKKG